MTSSLDSKIKGLAAEPGVYLMKGEGGEILYVGKAKNLKSRVSSYFRDSRDSSAKSPRTELLVRKIADFEVVLTDNEVEALVLECNLIKKYKPRYNVRLKDDKNFLYVRVDTEHPFPRLEFVRRPKKDGARYFGPYVSAFQIRDVLRWAQKAFKLRDCSDNEFRNRARPCILHQMGQCSGPCVGLISEEEYAKSVEAVLKLLDGKTNEVVRELRARMEQASAAEQFERAAELRDRIQHIDEISQKQKITDPNDSFDRDYIHYARDSVHAVVVVMAVREGRTVGVFQFPLADIDPAMPDDELLFGFMAQYYLSRYEETPQLLPKEVLVPIEELERETAVLSRAMGRGVEFRVPKRGEAADLVAMVKKTAAYHLGELATTAAHSLDDLNDVRRKLDLRKLPARIECYDISHFQGEGTVASRVVFVEGRPDKTLYRHYHVREVGTGSSGQGFGDQASPKGAPRIDDYKSLREVLERRFMNDPTLPDLVVVDGGKGQLAQAEAIFEELGVINVELVSLAKARTDRDFQETEVTGSMERVFKPNQKNPILLKPGTGAYRVLTQARDESHRFAITFHRKVRDKRVLKRRRK